VVVALFLLLKKALRVLDLVSAGVIAGLDFARKSQVTLIFDKVKKRLGLVHLEKMLKKALSMQ